MTKPPTGYYRETLHKVYPNIKLALTNSPMIGVIQLDPEPIIEVFEQSDDPMLQYYVNGLRTGTIVPIVERNVVDPYYKPGELYFGS